MNRSNILAFGVLAAAFLLLPFVYGRIVIQNDGISYYALTRSLIEDGDFDLTNQVEQFREVRVVDGGVEGQKSSQYSCGFALLYAPFVFTSDKILGAIPASALWRPYPQNSRIPFSHSLGIFIGSVLYGLLTVIISAVALRSLYSASWMSGMLVCLAVLVGTCLVFYNFVCPSFAHAADAFLIALAFLLVVLPLSSNPNRSAVRSMLIGFVLALSVLLRNNNIVLPPVMIAGYLLLAKRAHQNVLRNLVFIFIGAVPIILIHVFYNWSQYGAAIGTGYRLKEQMTISARIHNFWKLMFHPVAGVFFSTPITLLAVAGLIRGVQQRRAEAVLALACVLAVLCSLAFVGYIFPGSSFGQRLLAHLYIFWVVGIYEFLRWLKKPAAVLVVLCVAWSFLLLNLYFVGSADGSLRKNSWPIGYDPVAIIQSAAEARASALQSNPDENLFQLWHRSLSAFPYPTLQYILFHPDSKTKD